MSVQFDEHQMWETIGGVPVVNGYVYIGDVGVDPVLNPKSIFSDRALTVALANPVRTDSYGRAVSKIWLSGKYSLKVEDVDNNQLYQELENGEDPQAGITSLTNVLGTNAITAEAPTAISAYTDKELYIFKVVSQNTGAVTIKIDTAPTVSIKRNLDQDIVKAQFEVGQVVILAYNSTAGVMEWVNQNLKVAYDTEGAAIASAGTVDLSLATGNLVHITGNTTITSFGTGSVPAGTEYILVFDSNPQVSDGASLLMPGGQNRVMEPGTVARVVSEGSDVFRVVNIFIDQDGFSNYPPGFIDGLELSNGTDATNDIDVAVGACRAENSNFNMDLTSVLTKQIDANWAVGSAAGGFPSGLTLTNDTWYHFFLIKRSDTGVVDAGFDTSITAANLLTDAGSAYDSYRWIGAVRRETAANRLFRQTKNHVDYEVWQDDVPIAAAPLTRTLSTVSVPPDKKFLAKLNLALSTTAGSPDWAVYDPDIPDFTPSASAFTVRGLVGAANTFQSAIAEIRTNTSSQIAERSSEADDRQILCTGYVIER
jgi:hypothetical protein